MKRHVRFEPPALAFLALLVAPIAAALRNQGERADDAQPGAVVLVLEQNGHGRRARAPVGAEAGQFW
jgi:hypothetical protein